MPSRLLSPFAAARLPVGDGLDAQLLRPDPDAHAVAPPLTDADGTRSTVPSPRRTTDEGSPLLRHLAIEQVADAQEAGHEVGRGPLVQLLRWSELLDAAVAHDGDAIRHRHRLLLVVGDEDEGDPDLALDPLQLHLHLLAQLQVERAERLVEEQHLGVVDERARERDALLLPAGQLVRLARLVAGQLDELEHELDLVADLVRRDLAAAQAEGHVLEHVEVREERVVLEDRVGVALERRQAR